MKYCSMEFVIWITVAVFSTQTEAMVVIYGHLGGSVTLPKEQWGRHPLVQWDRSNSRVYNLLENSRSIGQDMKDRVSLARDERSLIIKNLKPEDFTTFKCVLVEDSKTHKTEYRLYQITVSATPAILLASQKLSLKCNADESAVPTTMEWSGPLAQKVGTSQIWSRDAVLEVASASVQHHGKWTCTVTYGDKTATASVSVTVVDLFPAPSQPLYPPPVSLPHLTRSLLLPCSLNDRFDVLSLAKVGFKGGRWDFSPFPWDFGREKSLSILSDKLRWDDGAALLEGQHRTNLSIVREVPENGGRYTCALDFHTGVTLSQTLRVEVLRIESSQGKPALLGQAHDLHCSLGHSSLNNLTVRWTAPRLSSVSPLPRPPHRPLLSIPRVTLKDKGIWKCQLLRDEKVLATAELNLKVERVPVDVWLLVSIGGAAVLLVLLLAFIFVRVRRHRQQRMFMRRRRMRKYCRCKHPQVKGFYKSSFTQ